MITLAFFVFSNCCWFIALFSSGVWFGLKYLYFPKFIREAERAADTFAVSHGMGKYILVTKDFILNHAHISAKYKARIKRLYLSPEEIMLLINENRNLEEELEV